MVSGVEAFPRRGDGIGVDIGREDLQLDVAPRAAICSRNSMASE